MSITRHRLFYPVALLVILLVSNVFFTPSFFNLRMQDGHLFGSTSTSRRSTSARPTLSSRSATSAAATSRRCCWRAG